MVLHVQTDNNKALKVLSNQSVLCDLQTYYFCKENFTGLHTLFSQNYTIRIGSTISTLQLCYDLTLPRAKYNYIYHSYGQVDATKSKGFRTPPISHCTINMRTLQLQLDEGFEQSFRFILILITIFKCLRLLKYV